MPVTRPCPGTKEVLQSASSLHYCLTGLLHSSNGPCTVPRSTCLAVPASLQLQSWTACCVSGGVSAYRGRVNLSLIQRQFDIA